MNLGASAQRPVMPADHVDSLHFFGMAYVKTTMIFITGLVFAIFLFNMVYIINRVVKHNNIFLSVLMGALSFISSLIFYDTVIKDPFDLKKRHRLKWGILLLIIDEWLLGVIAC